MTGYHAFQIRPIPQIRLLVRPEHNNPYDPYAMKVMMPSLEDIPLHLHELVTREASHRHPEAQRVQDIAGRQVGRVPANLCRAMRALMERDLISGQITATYCESVGPSVTPHALQSYQRGQYQDRPGGGAELSCIYLLRLRGSHIMSTNIIKDHVPRSDLERFRL